MGIGFIISIVFLAALLGIFSRQALKVTEERSNAEDDTLHSNHPQNPDEHDDSSHSHAM